MSDEARREAERVAASMNLLGGWLRDQRMHRRGVRLGFELGAEWQAEHDAGHIEALEAEVDRLRGVLDAADRQIEARTGETAGERLWKARAEQADAERDAAIELMQEAESDTERAEALLARIREFVTEHSVGPDDPFAYGQQVARRVLEILDGDANADDS